MNPVNCTRKIDCTICCEAIADTKKSNEKYTVEGDSSDVVCPKVCHHLFHKNCIQRWAKESDTCPNCNDPFLKKNLVYFKNFPKQYAQYLNEEIEWKDFIPPEGSLKLNEDVPEVNPLDPLLSLELQRLNFRYIEPPRFLFEPPRFNPPPIRVYRNEPNGIVNLFELAEWITKKLKKHPTSYATFQLGIACLQLFSTKWAQTLYRIQQGMLVFEVSAIVGKLSLINEEVPLPRISVIIAAVCTYAYMMKRYTFNRPKTLFSSLPKGLETLLSDKQAPLLQMHTFTPRSFQCVKWFIGTKVLLDSVLACKYSTSYQKSLVISAISFFILYQRKWVSFKRTLKSPLCGISYKGNGQFKSLDMATIELEILKPFGLKNFIDPELVKNLYDYTSDFFKDSRWSGCSLSKDGDLHAPHVEILSRPLHLKGMDLLPLIRWSGTITGYLSSRFSTWRGTSSIGLSFFKPN